MASLTFPITHETEDVIGYALSCLWGALSKGDEVLKRLDRIIRNESFYADNFEFVSSKNPQWIWFTFCLLMEKEKTNLLISSKRSSKLKDLVYIGNVTRLICPLCFNDMKLVRENEFPQDCVVHAARCGKGDAKAMIEKLRCMWSDFDVVSFLEVMCAVCNLKSVEKVDVKELQLHRSNIAHIFSMKDKEDFSKWYTTKFSKVCEKPYIKFQLFMNIRKVYQENPLIRKCKIEMEEKGELS